MAADPKTPDLKDLSSFKGSNKCNAKRWLKGLRLAFSNLHGYTSLEAYYYLKVMDALLEGDASSWADSTPHIRAILDKTEDDATVKPTEAELEYS